jgi:hypothetical protein
MVALMRESTASNTLEYERVPDRDPGEEEPVRLLSKRATARVLGGITEREVDKRIEAGDLDAVKLGRRRLIVAESVDAYAPEESRP